MHRLSAPTIASAALVFTVITWTVAAQAPRTAADGVYTDAQAARGQAVYKEQCSACHGAALDGGLAPPLSGVGFLGVWDKRPLADLVDKIQHTMPATAPGTLPRGQVTDIAAHILKTSGFRSGAAELQPDDTLKQIALVAPAGTQPAAVPPAGAAALMSSRPQGNVAQMMRGMLFPTSNLIFNVQNTDPGEVKVGWQPGDPSAFSWVDWGAGIYSGWELVDYAAIAITESAPLLLLPGRRCENGRPAPVERADWIQFTQQMAEAGRVAYRASQSRNREAVIESTNAIADACLACHEVYRDKPGGTTADPSNKAARCVP